MQAALIVEAGFQDEEFVYPYYRMLEEGWQVAVATPDGKDRFGKFGVPARATTTISALLVPDVLIIPGGFESPDRLRMREDVQMLCVRLANASRVIGAICHGPWVLISAGLVKGRMVTGYDSIWDDLKNAGGVLTRTEVATDGNIVTARHYRDNGAFMREVIRRAVAEKARRGEEWGPELCGAAAHP